MCWNDSSPVKRKVIIRISLIDVPPKNGARHYGLDTCLVIVKLGGRLCCDSRLYVFSAAGRFVMRLPGIPSCKFTIAHARPRVVEY